VGATCMYGEWHNNMLLVVHTGSSPHTRTCRSCHHNDAHKFCMQRCAQHGRVVFPRCDLFIRCSSTKSQLVSSCQEDNHSLGILGPVPPPTPPRPQVPLPPDAEGLVLTNINCHMGGVYLWETGHPAPPIDPPPGSSPSLRAAAQAVTQPRRQALSGGWGWGTCIWCSCEPLLQTTPAQEWAVRSPADDGLCCLMSLPCRWHH
jgi:hypothetical protein